MAENAMKNDIVNTQSLHHQESFPYHTPPTSPGGAAPFSTSSYIDFTAFGVSLPFNNLMTLLTMNNLPPEIVDEILCHCLQMHRGYKNSILELRLVSKRFNTYFRPYVFKTIQLEFSKFLTEEGKKQRVDAIKDVGNICEALHADMMVIRDEEEIDRLMTVFSSVVHEIPEMQSLLRSLRQFCMRKDTFDESDYKRMMAEVLNLVPNLTRLKLNLPFQVIGKASRTATILLACTFESLASRPPDHKPLEVLILDHISDSTLLNICNNPADLGNARRSFDGLKSLMLAIKRQESSTYNQIMFTQHLWDLIGHATGLQSLCIIGWNTKRSANRRVEPVDILMQPAEWSMKSLNYPGSRLDRPLKHLQCLELKRIDIDTGAFTRLIDDLSCSLKELYLNEVHLKIHGPRETDRAVSNLWIGHAPEQSKPPRAVWIAEYLRDHPTLKLNILRATSLGYDDFAAADDGQPFEDPPLGYDFEDPSGFRRSFDLRFVERAMGITEPLKKVTPDSSGEEEVTAPFVPSAPKHTYEVDAYQRTPFPYASEKRLGHALTQVQIERYKSCNELNNKLFPERADNNTTSHYKRSLDGVFFNHNERALAELQKIISVVDRSMSLLSREIERMSREAQEFRNGQHVPNGGGDLQ